MCVRDQLRHSRAGISFLGPTLVGLGRHISVPAGVNLFLAGINFFLAAIRISGPEWASFTLSRPACEVPGQIPAVRRPLSRLGCVSVRRAPAWSPAGLRPVSARCWAPAGPLHRRYPIRPQGFHAGWSLGRGWASDLPGRWSSPASAGLEPLVSGTFPGSEAGVRAKAGRAASWPTYSDPTETTRLRAAPASFQVSIRANYLVPCWSYL
jgi:hypothetical protein